MPIYLTITPINWLIEIMKFFGANNGNVTTKVSAIQQEYEYTFLHPNLEIILTL